MTIEELAARYPNASFSYKKILDINPLSGHKQFRRCSVPNQEMACIHKEFITLLRTFLGRYHHSCVGGNMYDSPNKALAYHQGHRYIYHMDLAQAFPSVNLERLTSSVFKFCSEGGKRRYNDAGFERMRNFIFKFFYNDKSVLATGGNASPDLFNLYLYDLDEDLWQWSNQSDISYCRYMDDLIFSSDLPLGKRSRRAICQIIRSYDLEINYKKTRYYDLRKGPAVILGIGIDQNGRLFVPGRFRRHVRGLLHLGKKDPELWPKIAGKMGVIYNVLPWGITLLSPEELDDFKATADNRVSQAELQLVSTFQIMKQRRCENQITG